MVDPERVRTKLGHLEEALQGLTEKQDCTEEEYRQSRDRRDVVERRFERGIQASLDIVAHIVASEGYREPADYGDLFRVLEEEKVLPSHVADRMVNMAGFRNVLAHEYSRIDDDLVYENLQNLEHFREFASEIQEFLDKKEEDEE